MKHVQGAESKTTLTDVRDEDIQSNAVDLRLQKVFMIRPSTFTITEDEKIHRGSVEIHPKDGGYFVLNPGSYEVIMENQIEVGEGEAGWVITRSTLNRNGVYLTSGLYDSGYHGVMAAVLHVTSGPMRIKRGTRIGQYLSFNAEMLHAYNGSYGFGRGDEERYEIAPGPVIPQVDLRGTDVKPAPAPDTLVTVVEEARSVSTAEKIRDLYLRGIDDVGEIANTLNIKRSYVSQILYKLWKEHKS